MSIPLAIVAYLLEVPHPGVISAGTIAKRLNAKLPSVSSSLHKMCETGELERVDGMGPRGGYGYRVSSETRRRHRPPPPPERADRYAMIEHEWI